MREFFKAIIVLLGSLIVSAVVLWFLFLYQLGYSIWRSVTLKKWNAFFVFWVKNIDGIFACIAHAIYHIAISLDMLWNVNGEALEDMITAEEETEFSKKNTTVSASVGKLELDNELNAYGKFCSKTLNVVFGQKRHAIDSWLIKLERERIENEYFN